MIGKTGLAGQYDFKIEFEYVPDSGGAGDPGAAAPPAGRDAPPVFDVVQTRLGLKIEPGKGPAGILAIDRVERPGGNQAACLARDKRVKSPGAKTSGTDGSVHAALRGWMLL